MKAIRVSAGAREYHLAQHERLDELRTATVDAVRGGGGLVEFTDPSGREVSLVVSPGVPVVFEIVEVPEPLSVPWRDERRGDSGFEYDL